MLKAPFKIPMILSGYPPDTCRVAWENFNFIINFKIKIKTTMSIAKKNIMASKAAFLQNARCCIMPFKKQLHPTCKHVDLMSLICGKSFFFLRQIKKKRKPTVIIKIKCLPNNTSLEALPKCSFRCV